MTKIGRIVFGVCAVALCVSQARADALEDAYLKARDAYVARFDPGGKELDYKKIEAPLNKAIADLQNRLRRIVGNPGIKGATGDGKYASDTLIKDDIGFGALDALVFTLDGKGDDRPRVYVTTTGLLGVWLKAHKDWWDKSVSNVPQTAAKALASGDFYTQAISADAAVVKFADLVVQAPAGDIVHAMLDRKQQDDGPGAPDEIIVATTRNGRLYIATAPALPKAPIIAACEKVWKDFEAKSNAAQKRYSDSGLKDEAALKRSETLRTQGDKAFRACYAEKIKGMPVYAKLNARAQSLIDSLPVR